MMTTVSGSQSTMRSDGVVDYPASAEEKQVQGVEISEPVASGIDLYCPLVGDLHAEVVAINERTVEWAAEMGLIQTEKQTSHLLASKIGWLVARGFPKGRVSALQIAADWTTLFCLLDDRIEKFPHAEMVGSFLKGLLDVFRGDAKSIDPEEPCVRALLDLRLRMLMEGTPRWVARFADRLQELFACFTSEAAHRAEANVMELAAYMRQREVTVGLYPQFELSELTDGIVLPDEVREHPALQRLMARASNIVGWANDIFTYEKEIAQGEIHNLVVVLMNGGDLSLVEAEEMAVRLHNAEVMAFLEEEAALPSFGPMVDGEVLRFTAVLKTWVRGHLDWARETGRYQPTQAKARTLPLAAGQAASQAAAK
jgi:5-epi-alpha-selinene synthase